MVSVVSQYEILVLTKNNPILCYSGISHHFTSVMLLKEPIIDKNITVLINTYRFSRQTDYPLDVIGSALVAERENNDVKSLRILKIIRDLIHYQIVAILKGAFHT